MMKLARPRGTRRSPWLFLLLALVTPLSCLAESPEEFVESKQNPYLDAEFSFSADPTKAVLTIITSTDDSSRSSLILYGDGRVELENNRRGRWVRAIDIHEMETILKTAVTHGLAEWDADTIRAQQLRDFGKPFPGRIDGLRVGVLLVLDKYQRGTYRVDSVNRVISVQSPKFVAEHFPKIPQFEGVVKILDWLRQQMKQAQESDP